MRIFTYPELPKSCSKLWYYLNDNGFEYSLMSDNCELGIHSDYSETCKYTQKQWPILMINGQLTDCSKTKIEEVNKKVFGFGSWIHGNYSGYAVVKQDKQCSKSARVRYFSGDNVDNIDGFCQKLFAVGLIYEYRLVVMDEPVAWIVKEKLTSSENLEGKVLNAWWTDRIDTYFTRDQRLKIMQFCKEINLEFGELDIMTDRKKIHIIDVNNIPGDRAFYYEGCKGLREYLGAKFKEICLKRL